MPETKQKTETTVQEKLRLIQDKLKEKEMLFNEILDSTLAGFWDWDIRKDYEYLSPTFKKMFGYEDHEMENHPSSWQKIIHPEDLPLTFAAYEEHVKTRGKVPFKTEVRYFHKNGHIVWVFCSGKVIEWAEDGSPARVVGCHINITDLKRTQQSLRRKTEELGRKNEELQQLTYIASHDLQEPIRNISGFISLVQRRHEKDLSGPVKKYFGFIRESAARLQQLVTDLLDFSNIGGEKQFVSIDLNELLKEVQFDLGLLIKENKAEINCSDLPKVKGSKTELHCLFQNLLNNSIKFKEENSKPKIEITSAETPEHWQFEVSDNGIGMDPNFASRAFQIFQKGQARSQYEGNGIGLAHCKKIVDMHNGFISIESQAGKGTTVRFSLAKS